MKLDLHPFSQQGSTPRDPEVNGASMEELERSSEASEDSNQKWENDEQAVGTTVKNVSVNSSEANVEESYSSEDEDSSKESMMTVNGSADENTASVPVRNHENSVNGFNTIVNQNDNSLSQEQFANDNGQVEINESALQNVNGGDNNEPRSSKTQDGSQESLNSNSQKGDDDSVMEINSDSEGNEDEESDSDSSEDDSSDDDISEDEGNPNGKNEDAVSIQDSDEESSQDKTLSNVHDKPATVMYLGNSNNTNNGNSSRKIESGDNSPTVLSDSDEYDEVSITPTRNNGNSGNTYQDESDVEEVAAWNGDNNKKPIVVNDTKKLADLATTVTGQKEPTVVIINTESNSKNNSIQQQVSQLNALQNVYSNITSRGTTVTPVFKQQNLIPNSNVVQPVQPVHSVQSSTVVLPSLTDDMFVVEAPSFIVPYVYEKPSLQPFRDFVDNLKEELTAKSDLDTSGADDFDTNIDLSSLKDLELAAQKDAASKKRKRKKPREDDDSWDAMSTDSEDLSDEDRPKTVVIKEKDETADALIASNLVNKETRLDKPKSDSYFDNPLGSFFMNIGMNLVQEHVQKDLLKQQKRKLNKENKTSTGNPKQTEAAITALMKNIESSSKKNEIYKYEMKKCSFCSFQSESGLAVEHHLETPHMRNNVYKCNFCPYEVKSPHDILYHMEAEHNMRGRLERAPAYHQCANCPFEDNGKGRLARHLISCAKKFKPEFNLLPPVEWEIPAKIPKVNRGRPMLTSYSYQPNVSQLSKTQPILMKPNQPNLLAANNINNSNNNNNAIHNAAAMYNRGRGRPLGGPAVTPISQRAVLGAPVVRGGMVFKNNQVILQNNYQLLQGGQTTIRANTGGVPPKPVQHQPSISITPLPRTTQAPSPSAAGLPPHIATSNNKATFVICEICDGYIKDLEQLRNHMMWIHKVKIHPKMIYNRPPLNCQKCQFRFFTDQGLERHLLGSHGLVTSSMQEAANKGKDAGRCPACGRVYQWKLLNHVARDHNMTLKPAHLSYKCTVCTATFGMYKQFENHVYSAHSVVARRVTEKTSKASSPSPNSSVSVTAISGSGLSKLSSLSTENILKPLRINDEITIIPQPARQKTDSPDVNRNNL